MNSPSYLTHQMECGPCPAYRTEPIGHWTVDSDFDLTVLFCARIENFQEALLFEIVFLKKEGEIH